MQNTSILRESSAFFCLKPKLGVKQILSPIGSIQAVTCVLYGQQKRMAGI